MVAHPLPNGNYREVGAHSQIASVVWSICNLLRGPYKRNEYRKVILPRTVLRRFDCILAPNLNGYINGFSAKVRDMMRRFGSDVQIAKMAEKDLLYLVIKQFAAIDLSPEHLRSSAPSSDFAL